jgi:hypothetical protein
MERSDLELVGLLVDGAREERLIVLDTSVRKDEAAQY